MSDKEYIVELGKVRASRLNEITSAVNNKVPKDKVGIKNEVESRYYDNLWEEAVSIEKKYGKWPVFDMEELESDDPALDIYNN